MHHGVFAMSEDELEDTSWSSNASEDEFEDPFESSDSDCDDEAVDPFMYCSPMYFAVARGMYDFDGQRFIRTS